MSTRWLRFTAILFVFLLSISSFSISVEGSQISSLASCHKSGYYIIPSDHFTQDWRGITLANHLLNVNWTVYRTIEDIPEYNAGSFVVPIKNQPVAPELAGSYFVSCSQELNVTVYHEPESFYPLMVQVIRPQIGVFYNNGSRWTAMLQLCLEELGFDIQAISTDDIENNKLDQFNVLAVGGGYHKYKSDLLTENGKAQINNFIYDGGGFFGSCGGAAFAMNVSGGLNMIDAGRRAASEQPAQNNGPIEINILNHSHPIWYGINSSNVSLPPWYGGAFSVKEDSITILGTYGKPSPGFHNYDINTYEVNKYMPEEWKNFEAAFGKVLNPEYGIGAPAIIEADYGEGKVLVTYPHPDTPDGPGHYYTVLANMIFYLSQEKPDLEPEYSINTTATAKELKSRVLEYIQYFENYKNTTDNINTFGIYNRAWTPTAKWNIGYAKSSPFHAHLGIQAFVEENLRYLNEIYTVLDKIENTEHLSPDAQLCVDQFLISLSELKISTQISEVDSHLPGFSHDYKKLILYWREIEIIRGLGCDVSDNITQNVSIDYNELKHSVIGSWPTYSPSYNALLKPLDQMYYQLSNVNYKAQQAELWIDYSTSTREKTFLSVITDYILGCNNAAWSVQEIILISQMHKSPSQFCSENSIFMFVGVPQKHERFLPEHHGILTR